MCVVVRVPAVVRMAVSAENGHVLRLLAVNHSLTVLQIANADPVKQLDVTYLSILHCNKTL